MAALRTTPVNQSIFSIDPTTNKPFIEYEDARKLVAKVIHKNAKNLMHKHLFEDLSQEVFLALSINEYDPAKSKPSTFIYMVARSHFGKLYNYGNNKGRDKEVSDFLLHDINEGREVFITEVLQVDETTPEDFLLFIDILEIHNYDSETSESITLPKDYRRQHKRKAV